ncbi:VWA domain-containing protein [Lampropedia puyangensis]|uniref:VWA domain-containing protein n=2 Tax=Lampropedia puyangensis TaxID=1330072 RepID=A0A4S8FCP3_9BURK|nr:VWA domain-containing protein [Lampropedia puyangensis]
MADEVVEPVALAVAPAHPSPAAPTVTLYGSPAMLEEASTMERLPSSSQRTVVAAPLHESHHGARPSLLETRERYERLSDNPVKRTVQESVSTLSLDVDTGSYSNVRRILHQGQLPAKDAVRVEEMVNYFPYEVSQAQGAHPFALQTEIATTPWNSENLLLRVSVKAVEQNVASMPPANLVFLVDVSGSMSTRDKLPLVQASLRQLVQQLRAQDKVSLVVYAGRVAVELAPTKGDDKATILAAIERLTAGGSTAGASALELAYQQARAGFIPGGINRVLLATDGDFNVGETNVEHIKNMVERQRATGISLTTLGYGQGNYNEALMQQIAQVGNGNYSYIDSLQEARKVLVDELSSTFNSVAADVKLQLEFNPQTVAEWRLIGYENRLLNEADFRNDQVDAVEIGAGKSVTALYEITPAGQEGLYSQRRYGAAAPVMQSTYESDEWGALRIRYKKPGQKTSIEVAQVVRRTSDDVQPSSEWGFSAAVAAFGQQLRGGTYLNQWTYADTLRLAKASLGEDAQGYRHGFVQLVELAQSLSPTAAQQR